MFAMSSTVRAAEADRDYWKGCAERDRQRIFEMAASYGKALMRSEALQTEMSAWVANKADNITPEQAAQMFYAQDDTWQAAFFNVMQTQVRAFHEANLSQFASAGVPAGEGQWYCAMAKLDREGFETIEAMFEHAKHHREKVS